MTQRPLILENTQDPWELIDTPWGVIEAWRASTIATGTMGALAQVADAVKNDAAELRARADEATALKALVHHVCDSVAGLEKRINRLADALEARQRADEEAAERQRKLDEEPIELPPDLDRPQDLPPAPIGEDETHQPGGELHAIAPKEAPPDDNVGDLPKELAEPPEPVPEPRGSVFPQPTSISLNKE